jgi:signal transduction histidine kinase
MQPRREYFQVVLVLAGLLGWALACAAGVSALGERDALTVRWLLAQAVFALAFYVNTQRPFVLPRGRVEWAALLIQLVTALYIAAWVEPRVAIPLFAIMAGQAAFCLSPWAASAFVVAQTAAVVGIWVRRGGGGTDLLALGKFGGLQLFALGVGILAIRELRARQELSRLHAELLATRSLFAESLRHAERVRIARSLHDEMGHQLTALSLQLEVASHAAVGQTASAVAKAQVLSRDLLASVRNVVGALRGTESLVVEPALRILSSGIPYPKVHLEVPQNLTVDQPAQADALFHCVQEALTNAVRHADAANVWVELASARNGVEVRVRDDGRGVRAVAPGHGLRGMRERLEEVGGTLEVESVLQRGFEVRAWVPLTTRAP